MDELSDSGSVLNWDSERLCIDSAHRYRDGSRYVQSLPRKWTRNPPVMCVALGGESALEVSIPSASIVAHGDFLTHLDSPLFYGSHHFHSFISPSKGISLQETDEGQVQYRIRYFIDNCLPKDLGVPVLNSHQGVLECTTSFLKKAEVCHVSVPLFFGSPIEPDNYGIWLLQGLPSAKKFNGIEKGVKYFCWLRHKWQLRLLEFMGISEEDVIRQDPWRLYSCKSLMVDQCTKVDLIPTDEDIALFAEIGARCNASGQVFERIYVSRRAISLKNGYRELQNEEELINALQVRGFAIVEPELLEFEHQVSLFASARVVVGLGGAGMFNCIFCRPGATIVNIESSTVFAFNHANLFSSLDLKYSFLFGIQDVDDPAPVHKRWFLDVKRAIRYIDELI